MQEITLKFETERDIALLVKIQEIADAMRHSLADNILWSLEKLHNSRL